MFDWLKCLFRERRKECRPVLIERRRKFKMTPRDADRQLTESIDRFQTVVKHRADLLK